ncbi:MAG: protein-tyrosine phosphatase family protein, partial [Candidatus Hydrogenedentales bacterium]
PLRIDELAIPRFPGIIGMTSCPGRKLVFPCRGLRGRGGDNGSIHEGDRDLAADLAVIQTWGAEILLSLIEPREYAIYGVERMRELIPEGILHLQFPIPDGSTPDAFWEKSWEVASPGIRAILRRGGRVCVHCIGGLGRTGLVAARLLVELGAQPEEAIRMVRKARPGAIETAAQEDYVRSLLPTRDSFS